MGLPLPIAPLAGSSPEARAEAVPRKVLPAARAPADQDRAGPVIDRAALPQEGITHRLGSIVRRIRINSGLTQTEVAGRAGMTAQAWSKIENYPRKDIGVRAFCRVAQALSLSGTQLMGMLESGPSDFTSSGN